MGMDGKRLSALPGFRESSGSYWRVQWQIYGQSTSAAGSFGSYVAGSQPRHLSKLFSDTSSMAIYRHQTGTVIIHYLLWDHQQLFSARIAPRKQKKSSFTRTLWPA